MPRPFPYLRIITSILALTLMAGWAGCGDSERFSYASEADEPNYREGTSLLKAGRRQEALTAFLKVIDKRRDDAPESHLEVGLLYAQHINDPLSAIYHFRKYLALRPNSPQAPLVRQRIDAAIRDFARTLPAQPLDSNQPQRVDLVATLDGLKQENEALKQQLAEARANRGLPIAPVASETVRSAAPAPAESTPLSFSVDTPLTVQTVRTRPASPAAESASPPPTVRTSPPPAAPAATRSTGPAAATVRVTPPASTTAARTTPTAPTAAVRRHTIRPGDTLSKLAQQYYNNRAKWRDIYAANRDVMKNEGDLKAGMVLKIP